MTKQELVKRIDDAVDLEERSIQIYRKHLGTALFWSGLPEWDRKQLGIYMNMLAKESAKHSVKLTALREKVEKGGKMFTKQDYVKYFLQIKKIEEDMGAGFLRDAEKLEDPEMKEFFTRLHKEEMAHSKVADAMLKMFEDK